MGRTGRWPIAVLASLAVHGLAVLIFSLAPPPELPASDQGREAALGFASEPVPVSTARQADAVGSEASPAAPKASRLADGVVASARASPLAPEGAAAAALDATAGSSALQAARLGGRAVPAAVPDIAPVGEAARSETAVALARPAATAAVAASSLVAPSAARVATPSPEASAIAASQLSASRITGQRAEATVVAAAIVAIPAAEPRAAEPLALTARPSPGDARVAAPSAPDATRAPAQSAAGARADPAEARGTVAGRLAAAGPAAARAEPETAGLRAAETAALATPAPSGLTWIGGTDRELDARSLATIGAFLGPDALREGAPVRDGIAGFLAAAPCSRMFAAFDPKIGAMALRGHVPSAPLGREMGAGLAAMIGGAIDVQADLFVLPEPQCGVLGALDAAGLPQSTEQQNDPLVVGEAVQAGIVQLYGGDRLSLTLEAPDYEALVYVDFYDSSGQVIHVVPHAAVPLRRHAPGSQLVIGGDNPDFASLALKIVPPFGRDLAVAIAVNRPLPAEPRPAVEPAGPYLAWLAEVLAELQKAPGFRGEWAYVFLDTAAR
ncbi:MAG: hypothetical protein AAGF76_13665 [Pseudomonadota bacterium]